MIRLVAVLSVALLLGIVALVAPVRTALVGRFTGNKAEAASQATPPADPAPLAVSVATAANRTFRDELFLSGTIIAREEAMVGVQIDGLRIAEVLAEDGDTVTAGQVLARLDRSQLEAQAAQSDAAMARANATIAQAKAQIEQFEAALTQAKADYDRGRQLGTGVLTQAALDGRLATAQSATAQLAGARSALSAAEADRMSQAAQRRELEVRIARTDVRAPVSGVVSRRSAKVGALAMGGSEPLFRLIENGAVDLDAEVPDDALGRLKVGMHSAVMLGSGEAPLAGQVRLISREVDRATRLGKIRIALPDAAPSRVGGFATATVTILDRQGVAVPASAVTRGERGRAVQIVRDDQVELRRVEVGLAFRDVVELTEGVAPGETVVARAAAFLRAGDRVKPIAPAVQETRR